MLAPFNLQKWIDNNRDLLKPPISNKNLYVEAGDFIVMIVGGPNARKDYHYNETEELFYQIEGDILVKTQQNGKVVDVHIKEGDIFLLPANTPHSPIRGENTVGLVIEKVRRNSDYKDGLMWFCEKCNTPLQDYKFNLENIEVDFLSRFKEFYSSEENRTCKNCGHVMEIDERFV
jgi:3-hydroxyanthranilate 3,4-dioxygenase|tara:strand:- start:2223 stop:2747 length:525 start_codon:yes stop_codon:yes gene_type:complete